MMTDAELYDVAMKASVGVLILAAWTYVVLEQRDTRRRLDRHRAAATTVGQPMPTIGRPLATSGHGRRPELLVTPAGLRSLQTAADPTLRLTRPPSVLPPEQSDLQRVLADAGRPLTATEMADRLGRQPWDLLPLIDRDMTAGRIRTAPGHTAGRTAYQLADTDTVRMPHGMSVLQGVAR